MPVGLGPPREGAGLQEKILCSCCRCSPLPHIPMGASGQALHLSSMFSQELGGTRSRVLMLCLQHRRSFLGPHTRAGRECWSALHTQARGSSFLLTGKALFSRYPPPTPSLLQPRGLHKAAQTFVLSSSHLQGPGLIQGGPPSQFHLCTAREPQPGPVSSRGKEEGLQLRQRPRWWLSPGPEACSLAAPCGPTAKRMSYLVHRCQQYVSSCHSGIPQLQDLLQFHTVL